MVERGLILNIHEVIDCIIRKHDASRRSHGSVIRYQSAHKFASGRLSCRADTAPEDHQHTRDRTESVARPQKYCYALMFLVTYTPSNSRTYTHSWIFYPPYKYLANRKRSEPPPKNQRLPTSTSSNPHNTSSCSAIRDPMHLGNMPPQVILARKGLAVAVRNWTAESRARGQ